MFIKKKVLILSFIYIFLTVYFINSTNNFENKIIQKTYTHKENIIGNDKNFIITNGFVSKVYHHDFIKKIKIDILYKKKHLEPKTVTTEVSIGYTKYKFSYQDIEIILIVTGTLKNEVYMISLKANLKDKSINVSDYNIIYSIHHNGIEFYQGYLIYKNSIIKTNFPTKITVTDNEIEISSFLMDDRDYNLVFGRENIIKNLPLHNTGQLISYFFNNSIYNDALKIKIFSDTNLNYSFLLQKYLFYLQCNSENNILRNDIFSQYTNTNNYRIFSQDLVKTLLILNRHKILSNYINTSFSQMNMDYKFKFTEDINYGGDLRSLFYLINALYYYHNYHSTRQISKQLFNKLYLQIKNLIKRDYRCNGSFLDVWNLNQDIQNKLNAGLHSVKDELIYYKLIKMTALLAYKTGNEDEYEKLIKYANLVKEHISKSVDSEYYYDIKEFESKIMLYKSGINIDVDRIMSFLVNNRIELDNDLKKNHLNLDKLEIIKRIYKQDYFEQLLAYQYKYIEIFKKTDNMDTSVLMILADKLLLSKLIAGLYNSLMQIHINLESDNREVIIQPVKLFKNDIIKIVLPVNQTFINYSMSDGKIDVAISTGTLRFYYIEEANELDYFSADYKETEYFNYDYSSRYTDKTFRQFEFDDIDEYNDTVPFYETEYEKKEIKNIWILQDRNIYSNDAIIKCLKYYQQSGFKNVIPGNYNIFDNLSDEDILVLPENKVLFQTEQGINIRDKLKKYLNDGGNVHVFSYKNISSEWSSNVNWMISDYKKNDVIKSYSYRIYKTDNVQRVNFFKETGYVEKLFRKKNFDNIKYPHFDNELELSAGWYWLIYQFTIQDNMNDKSIILYSDDIAKFSRRFLNGITVGDKKYITIDKNSEPELYNSFNRDDTNILAIQFFVPYNIIINLNIEGFYYDITEKKYQYYNYINQYSSPNPILIKPFSSLDIDYFGDIFLQYGSWLTKSRWSDYTLSLPYVTSTIQNMKNGNISEKFTYNDKNKSTMMFVNDNDMDVASFKNNMMNFYRYK